MKFLCSLRIFLTSLLLLESVLAQLCWVEEKTPVSKFYTTTETQYATCSYYCNWNQQRKTVSTTCSQNHCYVDYEVTKKQVCCDGYFSKGSECIPVCKEGCENGKCISPDSCRCNTGYFMVNGKCTPRCLSCINGNCVAPNQCICNVGFVKNTVGLCVPKCNDDCVNGICNDQNQCVCKDGFYFNEMLLEYGIRNNTVCTAKCDRPCENGICAGRNRCECLFGYKLNEKDKFRCDPVCDAGWVDCTNGQCLGPNKCVCNPGYIMEGNRCVPKCDPGCENGACTTPGECSCLIDYRKSNESHVCEPICEPPCDNGVCEGVNECKCLNGYRKVSGSVCEPICDARFIILQDGTCIAPNVLRCNDGFILQESVDRKVACLSKCKSGCFNGSCTADGTCQCYPGYQPTAGSSHVCEPMCEPPCKNADCVAPNKCECSYGYRRTSQYPDTCTFYCNPMEVDCSLGSCTDVNTCECPDGFELMEDTDAILRCLPLCDPACINGHCVDTNTCTCLLGYQSINASACQPVCEIICVNGFCSDPNYCSCHKGYVRVNDVNCAPFCNPEVVNCTFGSCTIPNVCECNNGFKLFIADGKSSCAPVCTELPINSVCVAPGIHRCLDGHEPGQDGHCGPVCDEDCGNGTCTAPNTCQCNSGFMINNTAHCESICESKCSEEAGVCEDLLCKCNNGFGNMESQYYCSPICTSCANGVCVAPDECECFEGFELSNVTAICEPVCSNCTEGCCSAPEVCQCIETGERIAEDGQISWMIICAVVGGLLGVTTTVVLVQYFKRRNINHVYECKYDPTTDQICVNEDSGEPY